MIRATILSVLILSFPFTSALATDCGKPGGIGLVSSAAPSTNRAPGLLTTLFSMNDGYAGNMFDLEIINPLEEITGFDINWTGAGEIVELEIYSKKGSCQYYDTRPSAWTLLSTGTGTGAGVDRPTFIDILGNSNYFIEGETYGLYIHVANYPDLSGCLGYTIASGPQTFANSDLSATCYHGKAHPAFSTTYTYRTWNGTIHYETAPPTSLKVSPTVISPWYGGTAVFKLTGGPDLANRKYGLFGTVSGTLPGTKLPGGLVLPVNWDWFTQLVLDFAVMGHPFFVDFIGQLDVDGNAEAVLDIPYGVPMTVDLMSNFAWCTAYPFDFVSNPVDLILEAPPPG